MASCANALSLLSRPMAVRIASTAAIGVPGGIASRRCMAELITKVARASPSTSSEMIIIGLPVLSTRSRTGTRSLLFETFFS